MRLGTLSQSLGSLRKNRLHHNMVAPPQFSAVQGLIGKPDQLRGLAAHPGKHGRHADTDRDDRFDGRSVMGNIGPGYRCPAFFAKG
jgi:hypothetical protein